MTQPPSSPSRAGQAIYSPLVLKVYDTWVLGISNHLLWRCPTAKLRSLYDRNVTARHVDIGVGTGYFLKHARWPVADPELTLVDLNKNSLSAASRRIKDLNPKTVVADVLKPFPSMGPFESASLCYLLHCLPGGMSEKSVVFDNVTKVLAPGGRVFGATILQGGAPRSTPAQKLMDAYNARGIFDNAHDDVDSLRAELGTRFKNVIIECEGCVALFEATST